MMSNWLCISCISVVALSIGLAVNYGDWHDERLLWHSLERFRSHYLLQRQTTPPEESCPVKGFLESQRTSHHFFVILDVIAGIGRRSGELPSERNRQRLQYILHNALSIDRDDHLM